MIPKKNLVLYCANTQTASTLRVVMDSKVRYRVHPVATAEEMRELILSKFHNYFSVAVVAFTSKHDGSMTAAKVASTHLIPTVFINETDEVLMGPSPYVTVYYAWKVAPMEWIERVRLLSIRKPGPTKFLKERVCA
jgi:hypothetical protein